MGRLFLLIMCDFVDGFAKRFGLKPEQFAENFRDNYQRHDVEQEQVSPHELANEYCGA